MVVVGRFAQRADSQHGGGREHGRPGQGGESDGDSSCDGGVNLGFAPSDPTPPAPVGAGSTGRPLPAGDLLRVGDV